MMTKLNVGLFHPGTQHSWQTAKALQEEGFLSWYATSIFYKERSFPYKLLSLLPVGERARLERELKRFYHPSLDVSLIHTFGAFEWSERIAMRAGFRRLASKLNFIGNRDFAVKVNRLRQRSPCSVLWGYDTSSSDVFRNADTEKRVLDKTIGDPVYYNRIMDEVYREYPQYFLSKNYKIPKKTIDIQQEEYELSDVIVCGSEFCSQTIRESNSDAIRNKTKVLEYNFDSDLFPVERADRSIKRDRPLNFLFLGQAGPRKGIHLVLQAFEKIPKSAANLLIVGDLQVPTDVFSRFRERVTWMPTVPRSEVAAYLKECDCLLFPSYFEGSAITLYEALALNTGIIQSRNTGIVLQEGSPFILDELSVTSIYNAVMTAVENPELLYHNQVHRADILNTHKFSAYKNRVKLLCQQIIK